MIQSFPKKISQIAFIAYFVALALTLVLFPNQSMPFYLYVFGIVSVAAFLFGSASYTKKWDSYSKRAFEKKVFRTAFLIRVAYALFIYFFNYAHYGNYTESNGADIGWYVGMGWDAVTSFNEGEWNIYRMWERWGIENSDMGYCFYLFLVYLFTFQTSDVIIPLILKGVWGALTCVLIYRISSRHFSESVARMTAIFCVLQFNLIWWCGSMMKETEMTFLTIWCVDCTDRLLRGYRQDGTIAGFVFSLLLLFLFRSALGLVAIMSLALSAFLQKGKAAKSVRNILIGAMVVLLVALPTGNLIINQAVEEVNLSQWSEQQQRNMAWRSTREGGNSFAQYAKAAVFAPLIFTLPFPSLVYTEQLQEMQMQVNGGNYIKNIMSFFVIFALLMMLLKNDWKSRLLPIAFLCGYLMALVMSNYAQSGRFHLPVVPLEMMFAAYGISILTPKVFKYFKLALIAEVVICVGWAWFKLAGRGIV